MPALYYNIVGASEDRRKIKSKETSHNHDQPLVSSTGVEGEERALCSRHTSDSQAGTSSGFYSRDPNTALLASA